MITTYGERALRFARGLGDIDAVIAENEHLGPAYLEAFRRRERGESFYTMIIADDARVSLAYASAPSILGNVGDIDMREHAFGQLARGTISIDGRAASDIWSETPYLHIANEFHLLGNAMLVRSYAEYMRITDTLPHLPRPVECVLSEPALPAFERRRPQRPTVVVWAPYRRASELALHVAGLGGYPAEIVLVAAEIESRPAGTRALKADDPMLPVILAVAGCIVCVEPNDPGDAVAFARHGIGVVAPRTSGAHEFIPNAVSWDAANAMRLVQAVSAAFAQPTSVRSTPSPIPRAPVIPEPPLPRAELPLVSIVIPTYNRPDQLRAALTAIGAQTYPRVEVVVVNDCGTPVDAVVADFPFARLIEHATNQGGTTAALTGTKAAAGDYIGFLPDDDLIYPDHVERLMSALLRSGAKIVHGNGMLRYVTFRPDGSFVTTGFNAALLSDTITPTLALIATPVSLNSVIHHRSVFEETGYWIIDSPLNDLELHIRQGQRYVFVHVSHTTFEFREHSGNLAKKLDFATEARRLYDEVHPRPDRPYLQANRAATAASFARRIPGQPAFPPTLTLTLP
jgi:hypothetical protein